MFVDERMLLPLTEFATVFTVFLYLIRRTSKIYVILYILIIFTILDINKIGIKCSYYKWEVYFKLVIFSLEPVWRWMNCCQGNAAVAHHVHKSEVLIHLEVREFAALGFHES